MNNDIKTRTLEEVEKELAETREELSNVKGTTAEVYSRIVGYYRSVRNWNKGKREEYGERKLYDPGVSLCTARKRLNTPAAQAAQEVHADVEKLLLFTRPTCPSCPQAKAAAGKLGIIVEQIDAATDDGLAEAARRNVLSTPTAILIAKDGSELARAQDPASIAKLSSLVAKAA